MEHKNIKVYSIIQHVRNGQLKFPKVAPVELLEITASKEILVSV